jgi:hypothetical protein
MRSPNAVRRWPAIATVLALTACTGHPRPQPSGGVTPTVTERLRIVAAPFALRAPLQREVAVSLDNVIYLAGGLGSAGTSANGVFSLDPSTGALAEIGTVPRAFHDAAGAVVGGSLFVFGGGAGESSDVVQALDLASHRARIAGHLPHALSDLASTVVRSSVYIVGGWDGSTLNSDVWATTDGTTFRHMATLPRGLRYAAVASLGSSIVVAGGIDASGRPVDTVSVIDAASGRVSALGHLPEAVGHASAFVLDGRLYVAGGLDANGKAVRQVVRVDPSAGTITAQPALPQPLSDAGTVVSAGAAWLIGGWRGTALSEILTGAVVRTATSPSGAAAPVPSSSVDPATVRPFAGLLLIADRGNDRLLVVDAMKHVVWRYPAPSLPAPPFRFYFPDDAFWVHGGNAILVSEEENDVVEEIAYPSGRVIWSYGHPGQPGSSVGYLSQPDDAYPVQGGGAMVADAKNCRLVFFDARGRFARQIGVTANADVTGSCFHAPPTHIGYPNGDTPLPDGHILISELRGGGWIDETDANGHLVWQTHVPGVTLPSDPQRLPDGTFLTVDYETPGRIVRFTSSGNVLWDYFVTAGQGELGNPSLAPPLPNGLIGVNDDFHDRMVLIDPSTKRIVWQYGHDGHPGTAHGYLNIPDGFDMLLPGGVTPLHADFGVDRVVQGRP